MKLTDLLRNAAFTLTVLIAANANLSAQKFPELGRTPQMGWNSWNKFGCNIDENLIKATADEMVSTGLRDAGYIYLNLDDCWHGQRDSNGFIQCDPDRFPGGMKALCDYVHSKGLKIGIYSDAGTHTCAGKPGSLGHEYQDALQYARWGFDYLKYDWCYTENVDPKGAYKLMRDALHATERPIFFSMCEWGTNKPWAWAAEVGNSWRTTGDIYAKFDVEGGHGWDNSILHILDLQDGLREFAGPGHWNDPDMLEVGNGMSVNEDRAHFTMWCMLAAPLILGNDLVTMTPETKAIILNRKMIAIDQDTLGIQGLRTAKDGGVEFWLKPLAGNDWAFVVLNRNPEDKTIKVEWNKLEFDDPIAERSTDFAQIIYEAENLWDASAGISGTDSDWTLTVPGHDVAAFRLHPSVRGGLVLQVTEGRDSLYKKSEQPMLGLTARNLTDSRIKGNATVKVLSDLGAEVLKRSLKFDVEPGGALKEEMKLPLKPGFYKVQIFKGTAKEGNKVSEFNIGYSAEEVVSAPDAQPDFNQFWETTLSELASVAPEYSATADSEHSGVGRDVYRVTMKSLGGATIGGWLVKPKNAAAGSCPARIIYMGYGSDAWIPDASSETDWIDFVVSTRGQGLFKDSNTYGDWVVYGLADKDNYYYRGAYMDAVRAIDFICSLPEVNKSAIFAEGGSQGGAFTLAAASLDHRLRAICPDVPFMSDFKDYFNIVHWPGDPIRKEATKLGISDPQLYKTLSYFDIKNFTSKITCPVFMAFGLQDATCPPRTNFSGFNNIRSEKQFVCYPHRGHDVWRESGWNDLKNTFYSKFIGK